MPQYFYVPRAEQSTIQEEAPRPRDQRVEEERGGYVRRTVETSTWGRQIEFTPTTIWYYTYLQSHGFTGSFSDFINQTILAYFKEKGVTVGTFESMSSPGSKGYVIVRKD